MLQQVFEHKRTSELVKRCFLALICLALLFSLGLAQETKAPTTKAPEPTSDLAEQIAQGGDITLEAGEYHLESLNLTSDTKLMGAGRDETIIHLSGDSSGLLAEDVKVEIQGISFVHTGNTSADLAVFRNSNVTLNDCSFSGARDLDEERNLGAGAYFNRSKAEIDDCHFNNNHTGVVAEIGSELSFDNVQVQDNSMDGLLLLDNSYTILEWSFVSGNGGHGVMTSNNAYLRMGRVTVEKNGKSGTVVSGHAHAVVVGVIFNQNKEIGFLINGTGQAWIDNSRANQNNVGFGFNGEAEAFLKLTKAEQNNLGYFAIGNANVTMMDNYAAKNEEHGFAFNDAATGTLTSNTSEANGFSGFALIKDAQVSFKLNLASNNLENGFLVRDNASAVIDENGVENNQLHGITVAHNATLELKNNQIRSNTEYGLFVTANEAITLSQEANTFEANGAGDSNYQAAQP